ncbi:MAG TPA: hypothetical protein VFE62_13180 [Gemmataceae bacterium]|nr:hypothetical protein [Gemmataceae bacterium]
MLDPNADIFRPPEIPTLVHCIHCDEEYDSYLIEWRETVCSDGKTRGFWCCPTPGCDGAGFGFDIFPVDPTYQDEGGAMFFTDDENEVNLPEDNEPLPEDRTPIEKPEEEGDEELPF